MTDKEWDLLGSLFDASSPCKGELLGMICWLCGENKEGITMVCQECKDKRRSDDEKIERLIAQGHSRHCALRQTIGNSLCVCKEGENK